MKCSGMYFVDVLFHELSDTLLVNQSFLNYSVYVQDGVCVLKAHNLQISVSKTNSMNFL